VITAWGLSSAWLDVSAVLFFILAGLGGGVNARHGESLAKAASAAPDGSIPDDIRARIFDPVYTAGVMIVGTSAVGIVFLMTTQPNLIISLITAALALLLGLLAAQRIRQPVTRPAASMSTPR
jgi:hypothetical protein